MKVGKLCSGSWGSEMAYSKYTGFEERKLRGDIHNLMNLKRGQEKRYSNWLAKIEKIMTKVLPEIEHKRTMCDIKIIALKAKLNGKYTDKKV